MTPGVTWGLRLLAIAVLLAGAWWLVVAPRMALQEERTAHAQTRSQHAATLERIAALNEVARTRAHAASAAVRRESAAIDQRLQEKADEAKRLGDDLARALRAGDRQLQDWWSCPAAGSDPGDAAADRTEADAARRADSTGRIAEAVEHDAAVIEWVWERWMADRRAVVAAGCAVEGAP